MLEELEMEVNKDILLFNYIENFIIFFKKFEEFENFIIINLYIFGKVVFKVCLWVIGNGIYLLFYYCIWRN